MLQSSKPRARCFSLRHQRLYSRVCALVESSSAAASTALATVRIVCAQRRPLHLLVMVLVVLVLSVPLVLSTLPFLYPTTTIYSFSHHVQNSVCLLGVDGRPRGWWTRHGADGEGWSYVSLRTAANPAS